MPRRHWILPKEYFDEVYNEYIARRDFMVKALNSMPGVYWPPAARRLLYCGLSCPLTTPTGSHSGSLRISAYNNQTVMRAPATGFYFTPGAGKNEVRVAYVLKIDDLRKPL